MEENEDKKINLNDLVSNIDDIVTVTRQRVVELQEAMVKAGELLQAREERLKELQNDNENLKKEIFASGPSQEFIDNLEGQVKDLHNEIDDVRGVLNSLGDFSNKFQDQLLALVELDKDMTEALLAYKFLR